MHLLKVTKRNKVFLLLSNLFIATTCILITMTSCDGCGNKNNKGGYIPNAKGNIAGAKVDKTELSGPKRDFVLSFIAKENKKTVNFSNYMLSLMVIDGQVSYSHFAKEGNNSGKRIQGQTSAFQLGVPLFLDKDKVEFTVGDVNNGKINIPFTIVPDPGADYVSVDLKLVKKGKNGEESKGEVRVVWRK